MAFHPLQCTENEANGDEDCAWCSGLMFNNAAHGRNVVPPTRYEYQALRVAGGDGPAEKPGDGSNMRQVEQGIIRRYHWDPIRLDVGTSFDVIWRNLQPGSCAVMTGRMGVFPRGGHWRRWDQQFSGGHSTFVTRDTSAARVWWMNPQAPAYYQGEWMSTAALRQFYNGLRGGALVARVGRLAPRPPTEEPMEPFSIPQYPSIAEAIRDTRLYEKSNFTGTSYLIPAGHTKRLLGRPPGSTTVVIIGHDRDASKDGKSALYGKASDWDVSVIP